MLFYIAKSYFIFLRTSNLRQTKKDKEQEGNALSSVFVTLQQLIMVHKRNNGGNNQMWHNPDNNQIII